MCNWSAPWRHHLCPSRTGWKAATYCRPTSLELPTVTTNRDGLGRKCYSMGKVKRFIYSIFFVLCASMQSNWFSVQISFIFHPRTAQNTGLRKSNTDSARICASWCVIFRRMMSVPTIAWVPTRLDGRTVQWDCTVSRSRQLCYLRSTKLYFLEISFFSPFSFFGLFLPLTTIHTNNHCRDSFKARVLYFLVTFYSATLHSAIAVYPKPFSWLIGVFGRM